MRVRPFFWALLASACAGVLIFAASISLNRTLPMHEQIDQVSPVTADATTVRLSLTDSEGIPIDRADITPRAFMPAMLMGPQRISVQALGQGVYLAWINFSMTGLWKIDIIARANGFAPVQQSIQLMCCERASLCPVLMVPARDFPSRCLYRLAGKANSPRYPYSH